MRARVSTGVLADPDRFYYQKGEQITIFLQVDENFEGEKWKGTLVCLTYCFVNEVKGSCIAK